MFLFEALNFENISNGVDNADNLGNSVTAWQVRAFVLGFLFDHSLAHTHGYVCLQHETVSTKFTTKRNDIRVIRPNVPMTKAENWQLMINAVNWQLMINAVNWQLMINAANWQLMINAANWQLIIKAANWQLIIKAANWQLIIKAANWQLIIKAAN